MVEFVVAILAVFILSWLARSDSPVPFLAAADGVQRRAIGGVGLTGAATALADEVRCDVAQKAAKGRQGNADDNKIGFDSAAFIC